MKSSKIALYNVIFPIWLLWLLPVTWWVVLPANFLIDLGVVVLTLRHLRVPQIKQNAKRVILKVWLCGFAADFVGTALMFSVNFINPDSDNWFGAWWYENIIVSNLNPFKSVPAFLWTTVCVVVTALCIFAVNYWLSLRKLEVEKDVRKKLAVSLAVFTAPYLFYLPTLWFYR